MRFSYLLRAHAVPLFISSKILPLNMLYVETVLSIMFDVSRMIVPPNTSDLLTKAKEKHMHKIRFSSSNNFYITASRLSQSQGSFARFGAKLWNSLHDKFRQLPKSAFKKHIQSMLLSILEVEDDYAKAPIILQKIANNVSDQFSYFSYPSFLSSINFVSCNSSNS